MAVKVAGPNGPWAALTWPGYNGVLNGVAKNRFAAALNQAPMEDPTGFMPLDWVVNRHKVWRSSAVTPAHLLREVFETATCYHEARRRLRDTPIAAPAIFILSGIGAQEGCVIERKMDEARIFETPASAANIWQDEGWSGHPRGSENNNRTACLLAHQRAPQEDDFSFLTAPVLNQYTRLAMIANAAKGRLTGIGIDKEKPCTQVLRLSLA